MIALKINSLKILLLLLMLSITINGQDVVDSSNVVEETDSGFIMTKSPWGAVGRSAIIPGWGQYYNEAYWKIPVVWGVLGWFTYLYVENNKLYNEFRNLYLESLEDGVGDSYYRRARDTYRNERDKYALVLGLSYLLNLVDAYVDAHLFDFDVTENPITHQPELGIRFRF
ncbi:MAG: DUF5683 domain-containing protein [Melioribacteraceae bacterium]|nr:DUF5683 domain-containing protein [Melioribacteraceae bacterium]